MKVNEIINLAVQQHREEMERINDEELKKFLDKTGMTLEEFDLAVLIGGFTGDFSWLEEKLNEGGKGDERTI